VGCNVPLHVVPSHFTLGHCRITACSEQRASPAVLKPIRNLLCFVRVLPGLCLVGVFLLHCMAMVICQGLDDLDNLVWASTECIFCKGGGGVITSPPKLRRTPHA